MSRGSEYASISTLVGTETLVVTDNPGVSGGTKKMTAAILAAQLAALVAPAWTAVTFAGTWVNFGSTYQVCQYRKIGDIVHLRGACKLGTLNSLVTTLPVGFRPPADLWIPTQANAAFAYLTIASAGTVTQTGAASNASLSLNVLFSTTA